MKNLNKNMTKMEKINNFFTTSISLLKIQTEPKKIYIYMGGSWYIYYNFF